MAYSECVIRKIREKSKACYWSLSTGRRPGPRIYLKNDIVDNMAKIVERLSGDINLRKKADRVYVFALEDESCDGIDRDTMLEVIGDVQASLEQEEFYWTLRLVDPDPPKQRTHRIHATFNVRAGAFALS